MKDAINFLPQKPEKKAETQRIKVIRLGSIIILIVFFIFNLGLFGFYFFLKKNTGDALANISRQEEIITNLSSTENLYRQLKQKLSFLTTIWLEPLKVSSGLAFVNGFMGPEANLEKMNFNQDGSIVLSLSSLDSGGMESFLNKGHQAEQDGKIKELKIDSVNKSLASKNSVDQKIDVSQSDYKFVLNFKLSDK